MQNTNDDVIATEDIFNQQPESLGVSPSDLASKSLNSKMVKKMVKLLGGKFPSDLKIERR